jgi:FkbM family methyltransferase
MTRLLYFLRRLTRFAYKVKGIGLGRACEFVRRTVAKHAPLTPLPIDDFRGTARFNCLLGEHMGSQIFFRGSYSGDQLRLLETLLGDDGVFIDVGANQGEFTIAAANVSRRGAVIAFEPVAEYRQRLLENIQLNGFNNVVVIPTALGENEESLPIYVSNKEFADGTRHDGLATLFATQDRSDLREVVVVRTMDKVLTELGVDRVNLIKLDIEGAEWTALRGAADTLERFRPLLMLEIGRQTCRAAGYEPEDFVEWLAGHHYRLERILDDGRTRPLPRGKLDDYQNVLARPA